MPARREWSLSCLLVLCSACGGALDAGAFHEAAGGGGDGGGAAGGAGASGGGGGAPTPVGNGTGHVAIRFQSTTAPFDHQDGLAGQTPLSHVSGVRSLRLYRGSDDPEPVTVFDLGEESVEISYADGADTLVYDAEIKYVPKATYTLARVVHSYVRYEIASTMHVNGAALPGTFDNMQVLSDGSLVDGLVRDHGYFEYVFETGAQSYPTSGSNAPVPEWSSSGGLSVSFDAGEWAYWFPTNLPVDPDLDTDVTLVFQVNMNESFRWSDQQSPGFSAGVFDTTPTSFEPVEQFGASSFEIQIQ